MEVIILLILLFIFNPLIFKIVSKVVKFALILIVLYILYKMVTGQ